MDQHPQAVADSVDEDDQDQDAGNEELPPLPEVSDEKVVEGKRLLQYNKKQEPEVTWRW